MRLFPVADLDLLALEFLKASFEGGRLRSRKIGGDCPVFPGLEGLDFSFALDDQPQGRRLNPAGRSSSANLLPQQRADLVSDQAVEDPPGLLGIHQSGIDLAGTIEGLSDGFLSDFVEENPKEFAIVVGQRFRQVPADGFSFAVGIGGDVDGIDSAGRRLEGPDYLLLAWNQFIGRLESVVQIHSQLFLGKIPYVAHGGLDAEVLAEVAVDGPRLGGGLDNDQ